MKVIVFVKATAHSEAGVMPSEQMLTEMMKFNEELVKAGIMLSGEGLHPSSRGYRVRFSGNERVVIDGPFAETKELVAGFWIWQVKSMEEALEWVKRCPNPMPTESEIEIRKFYEPEDFGDAFTPELKAKEESIRAESEKYIHPASSSAGHSLTPPRFENGKELLIAGLNEKYTFETRVNIPTQWHQFAGTYLGRVPKQVGKNTYGVCWKYEPGCGFDYLTGVEVGDESSLPKEFTSVRLPAQRYAVFTHTDHVSKIPQTLDAIWSKWLPSSGLQIAESASFERYTEQFNPETGIGGIEIWLPVKS